MRTHSNVSAPSSTVSASSTSDIPSGRIRGAARWDEDGAITAARRTEGTKAPAAQAEATRAAAARESFIVCLGVGL